MIKSNKDVIVIKKKVMLGVAPAIAIAAILISKNQPGPLLLFFIGISTGIIIGINLKD
ncbi:MAG: hypothetical protein K9M03_03030 [Kiritimatiellales bacterium]|nr:hypothetical protein [Kiritimatiellales bacterium]